MGLISQIQSDNDPRKNSQIVVPPFTGQVVPSNDAPAPQEEDFSGLGGMPLVSPSPNEVLPGEIPDSLPPVSTTAINGIDPNIAQPTVAVPPSQQSGAEFQPQEMPSDVKMEQAVANPVLNPANTPAMRQQQFQEQQNLAQFQKQNEALEIDTQDFFLSGNQLPALYEGEPPEMMAARQRKMDENIKLYQSNEQAQRSMNAGNIGKMSGPERVPNQFSPDSSEQALTNLPGIVQRNWFNSKDQLVDATGKLLGDAATAIGMTNPGNVFDPGAGARQWVDEVKKNPFQLFNPLNMLGIVPAIAGGKYADYGRGAYGALFYTLSLPGNIVKGTATDLYNVATGKQRFEGDAINASHAVLGKNYDFTQANSATTPLAVVGPSAIPRTAEDLKSRSWLWGNPISGTLIDAYQRGRTAITGKTDLGLPNMPITVTGFKGETILEAPLGQLMVQGLEIGTGVALDVLTDPLNTLVGGSNKVASVVNPPDVPPTSVIATPPKPSTPPALPSSQAPNIPPVSNLEVAKAAGVNLDEYSNFIPSVPVITGNTKLPAATTRHTIDPGTMTLSTEAKGPIIRQVEITPAPEAHVIYQQLRNAEPGAQVNADMLVNVERTNQQLTELAKFNGDITPSRTNALSTQRLEALGANYPDDTNPYRVFGPAINSDNLTNPGAYLELKPADNAIPNSIVARPIGKGNNFPALDVPLPTDTVSTVQELNSRYNRLSTEKDLTVRSQLAFEIDKLLDNFTNTRDVTQPKALVEVNSTLERQLRTTSPQGIAKLQAYVDRDFAYRDATVKYTQARQQFEGNMRNFQQALDELDDAPDLGRRPILDVAEMTPKPGKLLPEYQPKALEINTGEYYHGSRVRGLNLQDIDPAIGSARHELGPGIYITDRRLEAETYAKAQPHTNLPGVPGREFNEYGSVYKAKTDIRNPIDASAPPNFEVREAYLSAVREIAPKPVYDSLRKTLGKDSSQVPFEAFYTRLDEKLAKYYDVGFPEGEALSAQRLINSRLRELGYDAIVKEGATGRMINLLGGTPGNGMLSVEKLGDLGTGNLVQQAAERYNATSSSLERFMNDRVLKVQRDEARTTLATRLAEQSRENYEAAYRRVEDYSQQLADVEDDLRDAVAAEIRKKQDNRMREADRSDNRRIQQDSKPNNNPCEF